MKEPFKVALFSDSSDKPRIEHFEFFTMGEFLKFLVKQQDWHLEQDKMLPYLSSACMDNLEGLKRMHRTALEHFLSQDEENSLHPNSSPVHSV